MSRAPRTDNETLEAIADVAKEVMNAAVGRRSSPVEILNQAAAELSGLERCGRCGHWHREHDRRGPCLWIGNSKEPRFRTCDCKQFTTEIKIGQVNRTVNGGPNVRERQREI